MLFCYGRQTMGEFGVSNGNVRIKGSLFNITFTRQNNWILEWNSVTTLWLKHSTFQNIKLKKYKYDFKVKIFLLPNLPFIFTIKCTAYLLKSFKNNFKAFVLKTLLEEELEKIGALCIFTLKFHPKLNPVESRYRLA